MQFCVYRQPGEVNSSSTRADFVRNTCAGALVLKCPDFLINLETWQSLIRSLVSLALQVVSEYLCASASVSHKISPRSTSFTSLSHGLTMF